MPNKQFLRNSAGADQPAEKPNLLNEDLMLPTMALRQSAVVNNSLWMQKFADKAGVKLAPHGKTTMSPSLFKVQIGHGAWGMTLANAFQTGVAYAHGIKKILMANQLVGKQNIEKVLGLIESDPEFEFYCLVDNEKNIRDLADACRDRNLSRPLNLLIEIAPAHGRAGVRTSCEVMELAGVIRQQNPWVRLSGIECYEGVIHSKDPIPEVNEFLEFVSQTAVEVENAGLFDAEKLILTAGGTVFFDRVAEIFTKCQLKTPFDILIRPGCYLSHDSGIYEEFQQQLVARNSLAATIDSSLDSAIEVVTYVQSIPEPGLAILTMGKRDVSFDSGLPTPYKLYSCNKAELTALNDKWSLTDLNDQHAFMEFPKGSEIQVGDIVSLQVSHPCLTFDKWQEIALIDDDYNVVEMIQTFFG